MNTTLAGGWRTAVVLTAAISIAFLEIVAGLAAALRNTDPEIALRFFPIDARARGNLAANLLENRPPALAQAYPLLQASLTRDLAYPPSMRALAYTIAAKGSVEQARHLFATAAPLLRRDLPSQLWLIEDRVGANDISGALHHYDLALSTSQFAPPILFPVLRRAAENPDLTVPLSRLLAPSTGWKLDFLKYLIASSAPDRETTRLIDGLYRAGGHPPYEIPASLIWRLGQARRLDQAALVYRRVQPEESGGNLLRNGTFSRPDIYPPLVWMESQDGAFNVRQQPNGPDQGNSLFFSPNNGATGTMLAQSIALQPGHYLLSGKAGGTVTAIYWSLSCLDSDQHPVDHFYLPSRPQAGTQRYTVPFEIPGKNCAIQSLTLNVERRPLGVLEDGWVDDVRLVSMDRSSGVRR